MITQYYATVLQERDNQCYYVVTRLCRHHLSGHLRKKRNLCTYDEDLAASLTPQEKRWRSFDWWKRGMFVVPLCRSTHVLLFLCSMCQEANVGFRKNKNFFLNPTVYK